MESLLIYSNNYSEEVVYVLIWVHLNVFIKEIQSKTHTQQYFFHLDPKNAVD